VASTGTERISAAGTAAAAIAASIALWLSMGELRNSGKVQKSDLEATMQQRMADLDRYFAERPMLRRYFYDDDRRTVLPYPTRPRRANAEVMATAEMIIDLAATVASSTELMESGPADRWKTIFNAYYCESQATRKAWSAFGGSYSEETRLVLGAADPKAQWKRPGQVGCKISS
jgi:hypothetical protein